MQVLFRILKQTGLESQLFEGNLLNIAISELDFVDIEIRTEAFYEPREFSLVIGNTSFKLEEPVYHHQRYVYRINIDFLIDLLPGARDAHFNKDLINTDLGGRRIARIFINEIGLSKIYISNENFNLHVANVRVATSKLSSENYELITLYLISTGYFDSNIFYKTVIEGSQDDIRNTLLEALRKLQSKLAEWVRILPLFSHDPVSKYKEYGRITPYKMGLALDEDSIDWLADNISVIKNVSRTNPEVDFVIKARPVKVETVLVKELHRDSDSYENRVIHGFLLTLRRYLAHLTAQVSNLQPRTRIDTFRDFLISCFNNLIQQTLQDATDSLQNIYRFYRKELPVSVPIYGFPSKVDGFIKKFHYKQVLELIDYSRRLFNVNIDLNNFTLEVESFDKLFEIYCFHLIKDTLSNLLKQIEWESELLPNSSNKLAGKHQLQNGAETVTIHYENFPEEFRQFSPYAQYNPDFIIKLSRGHKTYFLIIDAKYKTYNSRKLQEDLSNLTLNYLHKIGPVSSDHQVIGLFTASLSSYGGNKVNTIFKQQYSMFAGGTNVLFPQIGSIEIFPKGLTIQANPFVQPLKMLLEFQD